MALLPVSVKGILHILRSVPYHFVEIAGELRGVFFNGETIAQRKGDDQSGYRQPRRGGYRQQGENEGEIDDGGLSFADLHAGAVENGKPPVFLHIAHRLKSSCILWFGLRCEYIMAEEESA